MRSKCQSLMWNRRLHLNDKHSPRLNSTNKLLKKIIKLFPRSILFWLILANPSHCNVHIHCVCVFCLRFVLFIMTSVLDHLSKCLVVRHAFPSSEIPFSIIFVHLIIHLIVHWISLSEVFFYDCGSYIFHIIENIF